MCRLESAARCAANPAVNVCCTCCAKLLGPIPLIARCRLESVARCASNPALDDMLDAEDALGEQLEALPYLMRYQYDRYGTAWDGALGKGPWATARSLLGQPVDRFTYEGAVGLTAAGYVCSRTRAQRHEREWWPSLTRPNPKPPGPQRTCRS